MFVPRSRARRRWGDRFGEMTQLIDRQFEVQVPLEIAWDHLARVEEWPSWARHIRRVVVEPSGNLCAESSGHIELTNGVTSTFRMTEFRPRDSWSWTGPFLWLTITYDHQFRAISHSSTILRWIVTAKGFGSSTLGRAFAVIYNRNLNAAIPRLVTELTGLINRNGTSAEPSDPAGAGPDG